MNRKFFSRRALIATTALATATALLTGCAGEGSGGASANEATTLNIDFATYNPLSLVLKEKGWLEASLKDQGVTVNWVQSAGSNKANEALRAGAIDVGSTAGSAALLARSNGSPIKTIDIYSQPEWAALVVAKDSPIKEVSDLKGKSVAATKGTDPYFFLLQALEQAGLGPDDVTVENLQHADGRAALENGSVDAWSGLDPIMAGAEENGATLIYRNLDFNTYGALNATESFLKDSPEVAQAVVDSYEKAREWAADNQQETATILADVAGLETPVAEKVILERSNLDVSAVPGEKLIDVLTVVGPIFVQTHDVTDQAAVDAALSTLIDDSFAKKADSSKVKAS
ncbi:aliphatic sulfonate ABC transporter substrate-binding protein [Paeniglutamicibacter sp. ZC-3]|uniref:aliphatic sulfonate ABC transporter substrate-binding protein n=1 Tax=Paeniglutamicibacter TaxID=1742990 RepID=UPI0021F740DE|nr:MULTISPECIES: aliphatic sulfonate ABC transporter substrate-binding protein [Paeniglutamicibacter]MCV9994513.1 aliphatic sulfonate ABC transporter substrate-binding protein [Paeniglutamicibacter sp. ZC-3]MDO2933756.1 aliphatic sulfonate ABC transporter substrate-binding protein [Paeniglutamicibacter sulfureus]